MASSLLRPLVIPNLPKTVILCPMPSILAAIRETRSDLQLKKSPFHSELYVADTFACVGPFLGAPAAVVLVESLIASDASQLILLSIGGGLNIRRAKLEIGDIVFPRGALSEEGTSKLYRAESETVPYTPSPLQNTLESRLQAIPNTTIHHGIIWTTDAPYQETEPKVALYQEKGAILVDMEFSALCTLANIHHIDLAAAFIVSDLLSTTWTPGFSSQAFRSTLNNVAREVLCHL